MNIARFNVEIVFQKNSCVIDGIGNHKNEWVECHSCHASISGEGGTEKNEAGTTVDAADISFLVRYCKAVLEIDRTGYRILFNGEIYNILSIDHMNFNRKAVKFKCQKVRR